MKIGILGGTFNPVHIGHLILAEEAREKLGLEKIIFVPANQPPHKDNGDIAAGSIRLKMLKLSIKGNKHFGVSDAEIKRQGRSYTIDTIREFKQKYPCDELYFIIGSDLLKYLDEWKDLAEINKMVKFIAATRPGYPLEKIPAYIKTLGIRAVDISGFEVRRCIQEDKSFRYLVPEAVFNYINKKGLYK
ncbi:MAG: nicotinate-nucleotide adenylyltransferase [Candidatus Omnitrophota bacterium]|jgi:nicotinate-nucleotide adenylyltransferase|nr:nicotinate-nucleotide adenylyltransferase [Candidatus Omnitrophota bacterium]MDD5518314.1 nicotinate-nucleotide adenylyltransferase [Candidatus Omnitrophota bacterium]